MRVQWLLILQLFTPMLFAEEQPLPSTVHKIKELVEEKKQSFTEIEVQQRKILSTLYDINKRVEALNKKSSRKNDRLMGAQASVKSVAREIAELKEKIQKQQTKLGKRLKALYQIQNLGSLKFLLSSARTGELERNLKYLKIISKRDFDMIYSYQENLKSLRDKEDDLKNKIKVYLADKKSYEKSKMMLEKQQDIKSQLMAKIRKSKKKTLTDIVQLRKQARALKLSLSDRQIKNLFEVSFYESKGRLNWPVQGEIVSKYGLQYDYEHHFKFANKGITLSPTGADLEVKTVFPGEVTFSNYLEGYGKTVILDHGDNYFSIYSNLKRVDVEEGEELKLGSAIGKLAKADGKKGHLYFEVRHYSEALNPEDWFKSQLIVKQ